MEGYQFTLKDLYDALDWSGVQATEEKWLAENEHVANASEKLTGEPDFLAKFRMVLLDEALHSDQYLRQTEAIIWLKRAGIWHQVVHFYEEHGLMANEMTLVV